MGTFIFKVDGVVVATWKDGDAMPSSVKRRCGDPSDMPKAKRDGFITYYSSGYCRLEYTSGK